jgi:bifunctional isochorismate lyase / aryl carrier protein
MPSRSHFPACARFRDLPDLGRSALLLIDLQRAFLEPGHSTSVRGPLSLLLRILLLSKAFGDLGRPVFATRHIHETPPPPGGMGSWWGSFLLESDPMSEIVQPVLDLEGIRFVSKHHYSAFRETGLEAILRAEGITTVVICGCMTHICVDTSAREAFQAGFDVAVVRDACSSTQASLHRSSLACLSHAVSRIPSTIELLSADCLRNARG